MVQPYCGADRLQQKTDRHVLRTTVHTRYTCRSVIADPSTTAAVPADHHRLFCLSRSTATAPSIIPSEPPWSLLLQQSSDAVFVNGSVVASRHLGFPALGALQVYSSRQAPRLQDCWRCTTYCSTTRGRTAAVVSARSDDRGQRSMLGDATLRFFEKN